MKITVYQAKGSAGKTPIATNIALDHDYAIGTNEAFHVYDGFIPDERLISLDLTEPFPEIPDGFDVVFDLAGAISKASHSITSALLQSNLVIVPIFNEVKSLAGGVGTLRELKKLKEFNADILVVATKLKKGKKEHFGKDEWNISQDFLNVQEAVKSAGFNYSVLPLKLSTAFDAIFERELSVSQISKADPLSAYSFREVSNQIEEIYNYIAKIENAKQK